MFEFEISIGGPAVQNAQMVCASKDECGRTQGLSPIRRRQIGKTTKPAQTGKPAIIWNCVTRYMEVMR